MKGNTLTTQDGLKELKEQIVRLAGKLDIDIVSLDIYSIEIEEEEQHDQSPLIENVDDEEVIGNDLPKQEVLRSIILNGVGEAEDLGEVTKKNEFFEKSLQHKDRAELLEALITRVKKLEELEPSNKYEGYNNNDVISYIQRLIKNWNNMFQKDNYTPFDLDVASIFKKSSDLVACEKNQNFLIDKFNLVNNESSGEKSNEKVSYFILQIILQNMQNNFSKATDIFRKECEIEEKKALMKEYNLLMEKFVNELVCYHERLDKIIRGSLVNLAFDIINKQYKVEQVVNKIKKTFDKKSIDSINISISTMKEQLYVLEKCTSELEEISLQSKKKELDKQKKEEIKKELEEQEKELKEQEKELKEQEKKLEELEEQEKKLEEQEKKLEELEEQEKKLEEQEKKLEEQEKELESISCKLKEELEVEKIEEEFQLESEEQKKELKEMEEKLKEKSDQLFKEAEEKLRLELEEQKKELKEIQEKLKEKSDQIFKEIEERTIKKIKKTEKTEIDENFETLYNRISKESLKESLSRSFSDNIYESKNVISFDDIQKNQGPLRIGRPFEHDKNQDSGIREMDRLREQHDYHLLNHNFTYDDENNNSFEGNDDSSELSTESDSDHHNDKENDDFLEEYNIQNLEKFPYCQLLVGINDLFKNDEVDVVQEEKERIEQFKLNIYFDVIAIDINNEFIDNNNLNKSFVEGIDFNTTFNDINNESNENLDETVIFNKTTNAKEYTEEQYRLDEEQEDSKVSAELSILCNQGQINESNENLNKTFIINTDQNQKITETTDAQKYTDEQNKLAEEQKYQDCWVNSNINFNYDIVEIKKYNKFNLKDLFFKWCKNISNNISSKYKAFKELITNKWFAETKCAEDFVEKFDGEINKEHNESGPESRNACIIVHLQEYNTDQVEEQLVVGYTFG